MKNIIKGKKIARQRIHRKIRKKVFGTKERPRLSVFRSANHIYAQLIDDEKGKILVSVSDLEIKKKTKSKKMERSAEVGKEIAKKALAQHIKKIVFDRGGFIFHGRIKRVADGAREGGLIF